MSESGLSPASPEAALPSSPANPQGRKRLAFVSFHRPAVVLGDQLHNQTTLVACGELSSPAVALLAPGSHRGSGGPQVHTVLKVQKVTGR